jgi:hypothetical protein
VTTERQRNVDDPTRRVYGSLTPEGKAEAAKAGIEFINAVEAGERAPAVCPEAVSLAWKCVTVPRFEYEDDRFYAVVVREGDRWALLLYEKHPRLGHDLLMEDRVLTEEKAKALIERAISCRR